MPRNNSNTGNKWFTCDRSGIEFPITELVYDNGLRVAKIYADEPGFKAPGADPRAVSNADERR